MSKRIKQLLIASATLFSVGLVLCIISVIAGASLSSASLLGYSKKDLTNIEKTFTYEEITGLDIELGTGTVEVKTGPEFRIVAENVPKQNFKYNVENNTLKIYEEQFAWKKNFILSLNFLWRDDRKVTIYIPENIELEKLDFDISAGKGIINGVTADNVILEASAGKLSVNHVVALKESKIELGAGKMVLNDISFNDCKMDISAGKITADGAFTGKTKISCGAGKANIETSLKENQYNYEGDVGAGKIHINDEKLKDGKSIDHGADNSFDIDCSAGSVSIKTK